MPPFLGLLMGLLPSLLESSKVRNHNITASNVDGYGFLSFSPIMMDCRCPCSPRCVERQGGDQDEQLKNVLNRIMNENIIGHDYLHVSMTYLVELCSGPGSAPLVHVSCLHLSLVLSWCWLV